jgi:hypothetical protein
MLDYPQREAGFSRAGYHGRRQAGRGSVGRYVDAHRWVVASFSSTRRDRQPREASSRIYTSTTRCSTESSARTASGAPWTPVPSTVHAVPPRHWRSGSWKNNSYARWGWSSSCGRTDAQGRSSACRRRPGTGSRPAAAPSRPAWRSTSSCGTNACTPWRCGSRGGCGRRWPTRPWSAGRRGSGGRVAGQGSGGAPWPGPGLLDSGEANVGAKMLAFARARLAEGAHVTGADLDRQFGTRDYGRRILRRLATESHTVGG